MQEVIQIASEIYMIVLCLVVGAADHKETRIDQVSSRGLMNMVIAQRSDQGFTLYDERRGRRVEFMTLLRKEDKPGAFVAKGPDGEEETIDVSTVVDNVGDLDSRRRSAQVLRVKGGSQIHVARSGSVTYLTESGSDRTYVVHSGDRLPARGVSGADQWTTKVYRLRYADAANIASTLRQNLLGPGEAAEVTVDVRTRSVIVTASNRLQEEAGQLVQELVDRFKFWDDTRLIYLIKEQRLRAERQQLRWDQVILRMHFRGGFQQPTLLNDVWAVLVDVVWAGILVWIGSGLGGGGWPG